MRVLYLTTIATILFCASAVAQNKTEQSKQQQIFSDTTIVWAAYFELEVVPDLPLEQVRKKHARLPHLAEGYGQLSDTLKFLKSSLDSSNHQMLNGFILGQTESIEFYETSGAEYTTRSQKLKAPLHHWNLALEDINVEPETFGTYQMLPHDYFEVFRLKGILYYRKDAHNFYAIPEAVAMLKNLDGDSEAVWDYEVIAWMPVSDLLKKRGWDNGLTTWAQHIERSIPLSDLFVFKQEWTSDEVFSHQTDYLRKNAARVNVLHPYSPQQKFSFDERANEVLEDEQFFPNRFKAMTAEEVKTIATYEEMAMKEDDYGDFEILNHPITWSVFKGIRFGMDWAWFNETKELSVEMKTYLPFDNAPDDGVDFFIPTYYYRLPFGALGK